MSSIYYTNWWPIWLDGHHSFYGMDIVPDPLNPANRCLKLPRLCQPPTYPADVSVRADSFGNYRDLKHRSYIFEPDGTAEHQLIFVNCGEVSGEAGDSAFSAPANSMIYLPPHTPTQYTFQKGDGQNYYWISFSGETANQLLSTAGLTTFTVVPANTPTLTAHIDHLLALPRTGAFYPYEVSSHLQLLLADVYRAICREKQQRTPPCIEEAALLLQNLGQVPPSNEQLARSCGMSTRHFLRLFKQYKGLSPQHYRTQKLMKQAAAILTTTEMTVTEITYALGMNDPYYFSRLFRAFHGLSPREYRKKHQHR